MKLSNLPYLDRFFTELAAWPLGYFKNRTSLSQFKPYISPKAQISCRNLHLGKSCFIDDFVTIYSEPDGEVWLDESVRIYRGTIIEVGQGGKVSIGQYSSVQAYCNLNSYIGHIRIGRQVMVGPQCGFVAYQHSIEDVSRPISEQVLTSKGDIVIEDDVWLGMGVKVMDGVCIGQGAVVGANAVVTKDIPPYSIAVGAPARVIRKRGEV